MHSDAPEPYETFAQRLMREYGTPEPRNAVADEREQAVARMIRACEPGILIATHQPTSPVVAYTCVPGTNRRSQ